MMEWKRGKIIGKGSFNSVYLATPTTRDWNQNPPLMAVKSTLASQSSLLRKEKEILTLFKDCPQILNCFGEDYTIENGEIFYNLLLEFASRGNLAELIKNSDGVVLESDVRCYTKSILQGLRSIHDKNYVHCDIKSQNILVCGPKEVKISDFGLAKKVGEKYGMRGTPLYMSPESVSSNEQEAPSDVWALGCVVLEMITGKLVWKCGPDTDVGALLFGIGFGEELPEIPEDLCEEVKDFLSKCFIRDPKKRWTAEMLLNHPFVIDDDDDDTVTLPEKDNPLSISPTSAFNFPEWSSPRSLDLNLIKSQPLDSYTCFDVEFDQLDGPYSPIPSSIDRIRQLETRKKPNWSSEDGWITVRKAETDELNRGV